MTTDKKVARHKGSLLELAVELNNVSKACRIILKKSVNGASRGKFVSAQSPK